MSRKSIIVLIVLAVAIIGAVAAWGDTREIAWTPQTLNLTLVSGTNASSAAQFRPNKNLNLVTATLSDNLLPYATVTPASIGKVSKGESITLTLSLSAPTNTPPHVITGEMTVYKDNGAAKVFSSLPVTLSLEPVPLPPDPGEQGKATLEGTDSDGDGLRDDVQRWIAIEFWDQPAVAAGLRQYARPLQSALLEADSEEAALARTEELGKARGCMEYRIGDLEEMIRVKDDLIIQMLNTDARSREYLKYNQQLGGHVFPGTPLPTADLCTEPIN